jgi:hypothetical protein
VGVTLSTDSAVDYRIEEKKRKEKKRKEKKRKEKKRKENKFKITIIKYKMSDIP